MTLTFAGVPAHRVGSVGTRGQSTDAVSYLDQKFEACFENHYARVVAYGRRRLPDLAAAEDAAAETFLIAWRRFGDAPSDQLPWLLAIARNVIFNQSRSNRRRQQLTARAAADRTLVDQPPDVTGIDDSRDDPAGHAAMVHAALARLSDRDREILLLTSWDGLTNRRAAAALGCSIGTFAVRLHRARGRLVQALSAAPPSERSTLGER